MHRLIATALLMVALGTASASPPGSGEPDKPPPSSKPPAGYSVATPSSPPGRGQPPAAVTGANVLKALPLPATPAPSSKARFDPGCSADLPHRCSDGRCREKCL